MSLPTRTITVGAVFLSDHLSRLYDAHGDLHTHVDLPDAIITVTKWDKKRVTAEMTDAAIADLYDDADYQAEFSGDLRRCAQATMASLHRQAPDLYLTVKV